MVQEMFEHFAKLKLNLMLHHLDCQLDPIAKSQQVCKKLLI